MEVKAQAKYVRISARKVRLVVNAIRGMDVGEALNKLRFTPKKAAVVIYKVLSSAIANASQRSGVDVDKLIIKTTYVDEGPTQKRWRARAMGRAYPIRKRSSHITVVVADRK